MFSEESSDKINDPFEGDSSDSFKIDDEIASDCSDEESLLSNTDKGESIVQQRKTQDHGTEYDQSSSSVPKATTTIVHPQQGARLYLKNNTLLQEVLVASKDSFAKELSNLTNMTTNESQSSLEVCPRSGKSKRQACVYCNILCTQLPRHLKRKHSNEFDVAKAESLSDKNAKRDAWKKLRIAGNFKHNCRVLTSGVGQLVVKKQPNSCNVPAKQFCHCPNCGQFMKSRNLIRHAKYCDGSTTKYDKVRLYSKLLLPANPQCQMMKYHWF